MPSRSTVATAHRSMRPITMPASASSNSGPSLSMRILANNSALILGRSTSSLCDFPRPRKCRTVRCARAQAHHSSSDGKRTSQLFTPPERIDTTNGFDASKPGFFSGFISLLLPDTGLRRDHGHGLQAVGAVEELHAGDLKRHDSVRVSQLSDIEAHLLDEHREGVVGVTGHGERGRASGQIDQIRILGRSGFDTDHELHPEDTIAPFETPLDLITVLRARAREEARPEVVLPGRFHGHEILGAAAGKVVDAVEGQRADHAGVELVRRIDGWKRNAAGRRVLAGSDAFRGEARAC